MTFDLLDVRCFLGDLRWHTLGAIRASYEMREKIVSQTMTHPGLHSLDRFVHNDGVDIILEAASRDVS